MLLHLHHSRIHLCHLRHLRHLHLQHVHLLRRVHEWRRRIRHAKVWIEGVRHCTILRHLGLHLLEQSSRIRRLDVVLFWRSIRSLSDLRDPGRSGAVNLADPGPAYLCSLSRFFPPAFIGFPRLVLGYLIFGVLRCLSFLVFSETDSSRIVGILRRGEGGSGTMQCGRIAQRHHRFFGRNRQTAA